MLQLDQLQTIVPAAFANKPADHVSDRYQFVRTADILEILYNEGWTANTARQQKVRIAEKELGTKHTIELRRAGVPAMRKDLGGLFPTIRIINSNDWSSRLQMMWGIFRQICTNGMIAGSVYDSYSVKHDEITENVQDVLARFTSASNQLLDGADLWSRTNLADEQVREFGRKAAAIRFGDSATEDHGQALTVARRVEDIPNTLWNVFNRTQENAVNGGPKVGEMSRSVRRLTNIATEREVNQELFDLAHSFTS